MKKTTLLKPWHFMVLLPLLGLSACGVGGNSSITASSSPAANSSSSTATSLTSASDKITVNFWHNMGHTNSELMDKMIAAFEKNHPNITIVSTSAAGGYGDLEDLLLTKINAHTTPTMAFCYPDHVAEYLAKDAVADMSAYVNDATIGFQASDGAHTDSNGKTLTGVDDYVKTFWDEGTNYTTTGLYSVPFAKSTEALFYNKTVFAQNGWEVPTTWDEMWALCQTIRDAYPQMSDGAYTYYPLGYDSDSNLYITLSQQKGIPFTSSAAGSHYLFNNDKAKTMMSELKGHYDDHLFITKGTTANSTYTSTKFTAGEIFMSIGSTGGTSYNDTNNFEVGVAAPPSVDVDKPAVISQGPSICFFKDATEAERRAGWEFYRFISTASNSTYYGVSTGYQPVRVSSYETEIYKSFLAATGSDANLFNTVAKVATGMTNSYFNSPVFVGSAKARTEVGGLVSSILLGTKTIDKAFSDAMSNCLN